MLYSKLSPAEKNSEYQLLKEEYQKIKNAGLKLDMSRGKPGSDQLDLSMGMLNMPLSAQDCVSGANDLRNYGILDGIPEAKKLFAELFDVNEANIIIGGNSSLNLMYDSVIRAMLFGVYGGKKSWSEQGEIAFLCPSPGYDRHFKICQTAGIKMINIKMNSDGPDMDEIERLVSADESIKGIWCVPKYSNPSGITYSDSVVRRFAKLKPAADDFRIFWDNAYIIHDLYGKGDSLLNLYSEAEKAGNADIVYMFTSTSKISFPGAGVSAMAISENNANFIKKQMGSQTIGYDKINQIRHVKYFKDISGIKNHMEKHAEILRPKFEKVLSVFEKELGSRGIASWENPKGGYFISLNLLSGCAKRAFSLAKEAGVTLTNVGETFPYGIDPDDSNLRIAPTYPSLGELEKALEALCICVRIASLELEQNN